MKKFSELLDKPEGQKEQEATTGHISIQPGFIVRIELHSIKNSNDYKHLYAVLSGLEFVEFVTTAQGQRFALPRATYFHPDTDPRTLMASSDVHKKATAAVKAAVEAEPLKTILENKEATIVVIKTQSVYWTGLKPYVPEAT